MTLTNRVSAFFLVAMAIVLVAYSLLLYGLARYYLYLEFDQQLYASLHALVAAVEVESDDVKWEPSDHTIQLGSEREIEDVRWVVYNQDGRLVDHSKNLSPTSSADSEVFAFGRSDSTDLLEPAIAGDWRFLRRRLVAPSPKPPGERDEREHAELMVAVARSTSELQTTLRQLMLLVIAVPVGVWLVAGVAGGWYCRRALRPLHRMAREAREISAADLGRRLRVDPRGDELAELGTALNHALDQLGQALDRQRRFTGDAAHQLRTPLTVLQGQIDVALRRPRAAEDYEATLAILKDQVVELSQLVEALLFLARADGEAMLPGLVQVEMSTWLLRYLERWEDHPRRVDLHLDIRSRGRCSIAPPLLTQLLDNLVANALKYSSPGSPVTLELDGTANQLTLAVIDEGIGIAPEDRETVFEPFFRSSQAMQLGIAGTGLGLALARRIAVAHNGALRLDASGARGSRFTLTLPCQSPAPSATPVSYASRLDP